MQSESETKRESNTGAREKGRDLGGRDVEEVLAWEQAELLRLLKGMDFQEELGRPCVCWVVHCRGPARDGRTWRLRT